MKKMLLLGVNIFLITLVTFAQNKELANIKLNDTTKKHPISLQFHAGTQGLGIDARYGITSQFSLRLGGSTVPPIKVENAFKFSGFEADNTLTGEVANVHLLADYSPFKTKSFRLVAGAAYLFKGNGGVKFSPTGTYSFDGLELTSEEVGNLNIDLSWKGIAPYFGIALFRTFPRKTFNINLDFGTYYLTTPKSTVVGTNLLADNDKIEPQLDENMKSYRFLPVLQLNFNFRIK